MPAFRSWVLGLLDHAEVVGPPDVRAAVVAWLRRWWHDVTRRPGRRTAEERLSRLLVMLPWLMERGEVPLAEVARRFGMSEAEVARDLELAAMCGLPPFVDEMIDVFIDDDTVVRRHPAAVHPAAAPDRARGLRPRRRRPGRDAAARRRPARARSVAGWRSWPPRSATTPWSSTCRCPPALAATIETLRGAIASAERLRVEYWTPSRDEVTERTITPRRRVQRSRRVVRRRRRRPLGRAADVPRRPHRVDRAHRRARRRGDGAGTRSASRDWFADAGLRRVTLRLSPAARWVVERYPVDEVVERRGGAVDATFPVASERWLERLLVRLGPEAEVREPAEWRGLGRDVARRVLARYAESGTRRVERVEVGLVETP